MIHAKEIHRVELDVRSSGDRRNRVDAYFVTFECGTRRRLPAPDTNGAAGLRFHAERHSR